MAPALRASSLAEMDPDYSSETQPRRPMNSEDSVDRHYWDSRGRRLFPQRRSSILTATSGNVNGITNFPTSKISATKDHSSIDRQDCNSDTGSRSSVDSVSTIKVCMSPTSNQPFPETRPRVGKGARVRTPYLTRSLPQSRLVEWPIASHNSSNKNLETSISAPLYSDTPPRSSLRWKSMAQFHKSGHLLRPRILPPLPNGKHTPCDSETTEDALVPEHDAFRGSLHFKKAPHHWSPGREQNTYVITKDQSRPDVSVQELTTWSCTVKLSTVATLTGDGRLCVHHLALLSVVMPTEELYAEKFSLSIVVANALRNNHKQCLRSGQSSLLFKEDVFQPGFFPREGVELVIVRERCDLRKPLNLYFAFTYPSSCLFFMASLPTFRPKKGRSLSEVVCIVEPLPPLSLRTFVRDPLSSWRLFHHPVSQVTCYERVGLSRIYSTRFQDDIQMRLLELEPVPFKAIEESTLFNAVWKLDISVHELSGEQVGCRMSFFLEAGAAAALVSLVPHGWVPRYFIVDGRVATEKGGECLKNKEGHITIFKQAHIAPGPIMVETYWQRPKEYKHGGFSMDSPPLPSVADRKVLEARLTCGANKELVLLNHLEERIRTYVSVDGTFILHPAMDAGYRILLKDVTEERPQQFRRPKFIRPPFLPPPKNVQLSKHTRKNSDAEVEIYHERGLRHTTNNAKGDAAPPKHQVRAFLLALLVLLLLAPGCLLFIDHVRRGNCHVDRTSWPAQDPPAMNGAGQGSEAFIDVTGWDPLEPVAASETNGDGVEKCEGWRDWIDVYVGGWKGCAM